MGMIFYIKWHRWCSLSGVFLLRILFLIQLWAFLKNTILAHSFPR